MRSIFCLAPAQVSVHNSYGGRRAWRCCFCQKTQHKVANLIAGPENLRIGDECVALMCNIIAEENDRWRKRQIKRLMKRDSLSN